MHCPLPPGWTSIGDPDSIRFVDESAGLVYNAPPLQSHFASFAKLMLGWRRDSGAVHEVSAALLSHRDAAAARSLRMRSQWSGPHRHESEANASGEFWLCKATGRSSPFDPCAAFDFLTRVAERLQRALQPHLNLPRRDKARPTKQAQKSSPRMPPNTRVSTPIPVGKIANAKHRCEIAAEHLHTILQQSPSVEQRSKKSQLEENVLPQVLPQNALPKNVSSPRRSLMGDPVPSAEASLFGRESAACPESCSSALRCATSASPRASVGSRLASGTSMKPRIPSVSLRPAGEDVPDRRIEVQADNESAPARTRSLERNLHMQTANEMLLRAMRQMPLEGMHLNSSRGRRRSSSQDQRLDPIDVSPKSVGCPGICGFPHMKTRLSELPTPGTFDSYPNALPPIASGDHGIAMDAPVRAPSPSRCVVTSSASKSECPTRCHGEDGVPASPRSPSLVSVPQLLLTPRLMEPGSPDSADSPSILILNPQTPPPRARPSTRRCTGAEVQKAMSEIERQKARSASRAGLSSSKRFPSPEVQQLLSTLDGHAVGQLVPPKHEHPLHARQSSRRIARGGA